MTAALAVLVKVTVVLALALVAARPGSRRTAAMRSLILACAFGLLVALPVTALMLPAREIEVPATYSLPFAVEPMTEVAPAAGSPAAADIASASSGRIGMPSVRVSVLLLWAAGSLACMVPLIAGLVSVRRIRAQGRPWTHASALSVVDVVLHDTVRVPVTFGLRRPVIALPADAPQWAESDLRRVMLHELEHVRRRDWPVHMVARAVCALYWFHPLVWIAWHRLCLESERACDDAVLREEDGTAYAAQLVSLARRISREDAPPLLSIAGRSHLSTRVSTMLARNVERGRVRVATVVILAAVAAVAALSIGPLKAVTRTQQPSENAATRLAFESASIRRHVPSTAGKVVWGLVRYDADGRVTGTNVDLVDLIVSAYGLYRWQVLKAPEWADGRAAVEKASYFDVHASAPRGASENDMRRMLRALLADRFGLAVRPEHRTQKVYDLVVEPGGHTLAPSDRKYVAAEDIWLRNDPRTWIATLDVDGITTGELARNLGFPMETLVIDRTGLSGRYRIAARWRSVPGTNEIVEAFPAQLGLRFRETTGSVEYLVVDRARRPALDAR